jgi:cell filamentation protein
MPRSQLFDPFGDLETRGYLRNAKGYKTASAVKRLEHSKHALALPGAMAALRKRRSLKYKDLLETHKRLFGQVYPTWAGQDRMTTLPHLNIHKGNIFFAPPQDVFRAADHAIKQGLDPKFMADHPGEVMGYLAYAHPFLEGNGRTILVVHTELCRRARISVDWRSVDHRAYLAALTRELQKPNQDLLDAFLQPFISANPDKRILPEHQPVFDPPPPSARTASRTDDVMQSAAVNSDKND